MDNPSPCEGGTITGLLGSFYTFITLYPQTTGSEVSPFEVSLRSELNLSIILSGLTISSFTRLGLTGLEYKAITLRSVLDRLQVTDRLVFIRSGSGELTLQRKEIALEWQLYGLWVRSFAVWVVEKAQFEETFMIRGSTAANATVLLETKVCLGATCDHWLSYERLTVSGISLAGIALRSVTTFRPTAPIEELLFLEFKVADLATVSVSMKVWPELLVSSTVTSTDELWRVMLSYDAQFNLTRATLIWLLPIAPQFLLRSITTVTPGVGIDQVFVFTLRAEPWDLSNTTIFRRARFEATEFSLRASFRALSFGMSARFAPTGLERMLISLGIGF